MHGLDVGDEDDLLEAVPEFLQELDDGVAAIDVERAEDLVEDEDREGMSLLGPLSFPG